MAKIEKIIEKSIDNINSVIDNALYSIYDFPLGGITANQMIKALNLEGLYQINSVYLCVEGNELYYKNHCYKYEGFQWTDITPWREVLDTSLSSISTVDENKIYNVEDYPINGITQQQMLDALTLEQTGFYKVNSVYLCIDEGEFYIQNHYYKFTFAEEGYQWVDITPWKETITTSLNDLTTVDENKLYDVVDYPVGGISNEQMINALTDNQKGYYKLNSVYLCIDEGVYTKNHFYKFNDLSWEDVTPEFAGELKDLTLEELESESIDEDILYNIKDYPIGGISSLQMINALKPEQIGFYQIGSVYLCTDDYSDYIKHHFYKFDYNEETDTYSWVDTKAGADIDKELSLESENPVANKVVTEALEEKVSLIDDEIIKGQKVFAERPQVGEERDINLPLNFTEVEYIQRSNSEYTEIPYKPNSNTKVEVKFLTDGDPALNTTANFVFGAATNFNSNAFEFAVTDGGFFTYGNKGNIDLKKIKTHTEHVVIFDKGLIYLDGELQQSFSNVSAFSAPVNLCIFSSNRNGTFFTNPHKLNIYYLKVYENDNLLYHLIPSYPNKNIEINDVNYSAGTLGLYDLVNGGFYINKGPGSFVKGNDILSGELLALQSEIPEIEINNGKPTTKIMNTFSFNGENYALPISGEGGNGGGNNSGIQIKDDYINGTSGYRIWNNGYCEQWGLVTSGQNTTIQYLKEFADTNYNLLVTNNSPTSYNSGIPLSQDGYKTKSTTGFTAYADGNLYKNWRAYGYLAEGEY